MSHQPLSIVIVGEADPGCAPLLQSQPRPDLRRIATLRDLPALCAAQPTDVVLLSATNGDRFDPAVIENLRQQDEAADRYTCVVQCVEHEGGDTALLAGIDDVLTMPLDGDALALRLRACGRLAALETALRRLRPHLPAEEMLLQDPLTGLGNRRYFTHHLAALLLETQARDGLTCAVLLSIDRLDHIGERHGLAVRHAIVRDVGLRLRKILRPADLLARSGDNEFAIVLRHADKGRLRPWIFERLLRAVSYPPFRIGDQEMEITVSIGGYCSDGTGASTVTDVLTAAGDHLRDAQAAGGNILKM